MSMFKSSRTPKVDWKTREVERVIDNIRRGYKVVVILRGLPGSGKSHLARNILKESLGHLHGMWYIFPLNLNQRDVYNESRAQYAMHFGVSPIIIDHTNIQMWEMYPYAKKATECGYLIEILEPNTWWAYSVLELSKRTNHNVCINKIIEMSNHYDGTVTVNKLFECYNLEYRFQTPQYRLMPPVLNLEQYRFLQQNQLVDVPDWQNILWYHSLHINPTHGDTKSISYFNLDCNALMCATENTLSSEESSEEVTSVTQEESDQCKTESPLKTADQSCMTDNEDQDNQIEYIFYLLVKLPPSALERVQSFCNTANLKRTVESNANLIDKESDYNRPSTSKVFKNEDEDSGDNNKVELTLGEAFIQQLSSLFGGKRVAQGFPTLVEIPVALARNIYSFYIKSLDAYLYGSEEEEEETQNIEEIFDDCLRIRDQEPHEEDNLEFDLSFENLCNKFSHIDKTALAKIYQSYAYNYDKTVEALSASVALEYENELRKIFDRCTSDVNQNEENSQRNEGEIRGEDLKRGCKRGRMSRSREKKVNTDCSKSHERESDSYANKTYFASALLKHHQKKEKFYTLDLHQFYIPEALFTLDIFIDKHLFLLKEGYGNPRKELYIITDMGKNNEEEHCKLKLAVVVRLRGRKIEFFEINSDIIKIVLRWNTPMTSDIA